GGMGGRDRGRGADDDQHRQADSAPRPRRQISHHAFSLVSAAAGRPDRRPRCAARVIAYWSDSIETVRRGPRGGHHCQQWPAGPSSQTSSGAGGSRHGGADGPGRKPGQVKGGTTSGRAGPTGACAAPPLRLPSNAMDLPRTASVVIIGGGVVGCSIAYHLARLGMRDVLVLERDAVGSGTTSKAAGGIRGQFP